LLLAAVAGIAAVALLIVGFGTYRELVGFPGEAVAYVSGQKVSLRLFTDDLTDEMRNLQNQVARAARTRLIPRPPAPRSRS